MLQLTICLILISTGVVPAQTATRPAPGAPVVPLTALARMPVKEVTVFKDGHAFVSHEGVMQPDASGNVVLDSLPAPVLGTFWPYAAKGGPRLTAVVASKQRSIIRRTPLSLRELLEANVGAEGVVTETGGLKYPGTILDVPARSAEELEVTGVPGADPRLPEKGSLILIRTYEGVKAVPVDRIQDFTFKNAPSAEVETEEFRNLLTLKLDWSEHSGGRRARVGLAYLQKGLRWIPTYRIAIDGEGKAVLRLQATLVNELTDLEDVTLHLVVGVPSFAFKDTPDPISFQQVITQVMQQAPARPGAFQFSNAIMAQTQIVDARMTEYRAAPQPSAVDLGPELAGTSKAEDLFVFTVEHVTLRKGQRMVLPVAEYAVEYKDVFTLDLPFSPPAEVRANVSTEQQAELARMLLAPKVMHKIRLTNTGTYPFTTAPALIVRGDRVLGQGMMTYAAPGGSADVEVTAAVDVHVRKTDREVNRIPNAMQWQGTQFARVELEGTLTLTSFRKQPVEVEVTRSVLGNVKSAQRAGRIEAVNYLEEGSSLGRWDYPSWWGWYSWPYWWSHFNAIGRVRWTVKLEPGEKVDLGYEWNYYWN